MPKIDLEQAYIDLKQRFDKLEENMSSAQAQARKDIEAKETEIKLRGDRISELQTEIAGLKAELAKKDGDRDVLNEKITQSQKLIESLEGDKARLEKEKDELVATFKADKDNNTEQVQNLHAHLDRMGDQFVALENKVITQLASELKDLKDRSSQDKVMKDKDAFYAEKETLLKSKIAAETKAQTLEKEMKELRVKMRESGDGLLGSSMEIETLKEKLKQKEQEMQKIQERVLSLTTGKTGVVMELADLVKIMKEKLTRGKRNVRVVLPNMQDFERHGFIPLLEKLPTQAVVYVAAFMDTAKQEDLINTLRDKKVQMTNFQERNMYGLNVDGAECLLGLVAPENPDRILAGFFTDIEAAVPVFKDAIQKAWVKGTRM